jgi:hypothetical protein
MIYPQKPDGFLEASLTSDVDQIVGQATIIPKEKFWIGRRFLLWNCNSTTFVSIMRYLERVDPLYSCTEL